MDSAYGPNLDASLDTSVPSPSRNSWDGEGSTKPYVLFGFVEAARFLGGQEFAQTRAGSEPARAKLAATRKA
jgi:hypothetical protein